MAGLAKIKKKVSVCATCDMWKGEVRHPSEDRLYVVYESFQRGLCSGPIKRGLSMTPLNKCRAWRVWKKLNKPRTDDYSVFGEEEEREPIGFYEPPDQHVEYDRDTDLGPVHEGVKYHKRPDTGHPDHPLKVPRKKLAAPAVQPKDQQEEEMDRPLPG